ncbi:MAG TPA: hypothetical protein VJZ00_10940 [Thermoanaerobaculia bacterium]|nr:hypothetical protein [Thermoanaerobaculia bacterium]
MFIASVVVALAIPAEARPAAGEGPRLTNNPVVKVLKFVKKFVIKTFGDGLTDPKP